MRVWGLLKAGDEVPAGADSARARAGLTLVDLRKTPVHKRILSG